MGNVRGIIQYIIIGAAASVIMTAAAAPAAAATRTWDGGAADNNWQTPVNWADDIAPAAGDDLVFPAGVTDMATVNDFPAGTEFTSITLESEGYWITGSRILLASAIAMTGTGNVIVSCDVTLKGGASGGPFDVTLSVGASAYLFMNGVIDGSGAVPATLVKDGPGWLDLNGANTYTGPTTLVLGQVVVGHAQAFGGSTAGTTVVDASVILKADVVAEPLFANPSSLNSYVLSCDANPAGPAICTWGGPIHITGSLTGFSANTGKVLRLNGVISGDNLYTQGPGIVELGAVSIYTGPTTAASALRLIGHDRIPASSRLNLSRAFELNGFSQTVAGISALEGTAVAMGAGTLTLDVPQNGVVGSSGTMSGTGALIKKGEGTQYLHGTTHTFSGVTTILAGTLGLHGTLHGPVALQGGSFRGLGFVKALTATGGRLEPGLQPHATARLTTDSLTLGAAVTLSIDVNGPAVNDEYDQLRPQGPVTLGNATLELNVNSGLTSIVSAIIIDNTSSSPINGTFAGLPEGALVTSNGKGFLITYSGGDGNDVELKPATYEYYLAEGATGPFFDLDILIANPNTVAANVTLTFLRPDGSTVVEQRVVAAKSRLTVRVDEIAAVSETAVSTIVTSVDHLPLIVERTMRWGADGYGAHTEQAVSGMAPNWYFAEGAQGFFSTYLLLANPQAAANNATVTYLRENAPAIVRTYPLAPKSRFTVDAGADSELVGHSFGMRVTFDQPGVAERSMYFGADPLWTGGHESAGVTAPSTTWFLAEGATGSFFETFILIANPMDYPSEVTVTFLPTTGAPVEKTFNLPAFERRTLNIEAEDPSLANAAVATSVSATAPIVVERAQYWPDPAPQWYEAHNSFGVSETRQKWGLAEGRVGGPQVYQTYILIANPYAETAHVTITFLRENGAPFDKTFTVEPRSRFTVDVGPGTLVPELADERFGAIVVSDVDIAVERAMYSNANGQVWAAGTNATATPLP
jgi:autotransporter-associated beta strand protein